MTARNNQHPAPTTAQHTPTTTNHRQDPAEHTPEDQRRAAYIRQVIDAAAPPTPELLARLAGLLRRRNTDNDPTQDRTT